MSVGFLSTPEPTEAAQRLFDDDLAGVGYVMNLSRLWAYLPGAKDALFDLLDKATEASGLTLLQRGILVTACASTVGDSYCSLAWGNRLAGAADPQLAAAVLAGSNDGLEESDRVLAEWARQLVKDPNGTSPADVDKLRAAGFTDRQIFALTVYVAGRIAFSTVNDALGACPDAELATRAPSEVRAAVGYGRRPEAGSAS